MKFVFYFVIEQKLLISGRKNVDVSRIQRVCHVIYMFFGSYFGKR